MENVQGLCPIDESGGAIPSIKAGPETRPVASRPNLEIFGCLLLIIELGRKRASGKFWTIHAGWPSRDMDFERRPAAVKTESGPKSDWQGDRACLSIDIKIKKEYSALEKSCSQQLLF